jgi:hypothetical protein
MENTKFWRLDLFPFSDEGRKSPTINQRLRFALSMGPNRVGVSVSSPEDGNGSSFKDDVFSIYLEFQAMNKALKTSYSVLRTTVKTIFRFCL